MREKSLELSALDAEFSSLIANNALAAELAGIASVSDLVAFTEFLRHAFDQWLYYEIDVPITEATARQISQVLRSGSAFLKRLEGLLELEKRLGGPLRAAAPGPPAAGEFIAVLISNVSRFLPLLKLYQWRTTGRQHKPGRPVGAKGNPALSHLAFMLQLAALSAGGKFTLDKNTREGSLINALHLIRRHLMVKERLPAPGRHPVFAYQEALRMARVAWAAGQARNLHLRLDD
jgi:hypothetical protein